MARLILVVLGTLLVAGCGYHEGRVQPAEESYIRFEGKWRDASVYFDKNPDPVVLEIIAPPPPETGGPEDVIYPPLTYAISPGTHRIRVFRDDQLVVDRVLYLGDQTTMEVNIP
jgi:hypothetical protein